jgi:hypothetical protein
VVAVLVLAVQTELRDQLKHSLAHAVAHTRQQRAGLVELMVLVAVTETHAVDLEQAVAVQLELSGPERLVLSHPQIQATFECESI